MSTGKGFFKIAAIVAAATIGSGMFALPYVIASAGWLLSIFYFAIFIVLLSVAHIVYLKTLASVGEKERLLGLSRKYFGIPGFWIGFIAIVLGLLLSFTAYLIIGPQFVSLLFPTMPPSIALALFWCFISAPIFLRNNNVTHLEELGIFCTSCVIFFIFASGHPLSALANIPPVDVHYFFLPLGAILFSLAGWTSVESVYDVAKEIKNNTIVFAAFIAGTAFSAFLYFLFSVGIFGSVPQITVNVLSGLGHWPFWKKDIVAIIGLFAVLTASMPLTRELCNAFEKDLQWRPSYARFTIIGVPLLIILSGFNNFLMVVSIIGGLFLSTQYLLIISIGSRALALSRTQRLFLSMTAAVFIFAAAYSVYSFLFL